MRGFTGRIEGSGGKPGCLGGWWSLPSFRTGITGGGADRAGGQKIRSLIWGILVSDIQEVIRYAAGIWISGPEAGGRLGLESYLYAWELPSCSSHRKAGPRTELEKHHV